MNGQRAFGPTRMLIVAALGGLLASGLFSRVEAQAKPEGEMRWALYVTVPPAWLDPGEVQGFITPLDSVRAPRCAGQADARQHHDAEPGRVVDAQPRPEDLRVQAAPGAQVPQRGSVHGGGRQVQLLAGQELADPQGKGTRDRDCRSL